MSIRSLTLALIVSIAAICFDPVFFIGASEKPDYTEVFKNATAFNNFQTLQGNSLLATTYKPRKSINVTVTGYSSTVEETDSTPFITATGNQVRDGIVAANFLSFGSKIMIPELYGSKVFVVDDRMHPRLQKHVDIWFPSKAQAVKFGKNYTYIEILE